jgi:hypothetical protein
VLLKSGSLIAVAALFALVLAACNSTPDEALFPYPTALFRPDTTPGITITTASATALSTPVSAA